MKKAILFISLLVFLSFSSCITINTNEEVKEEKTFQEKTENGDPIGLLLLVIIVGSPICYVLYVMSKPKNMVHNR